MKQKKLRTFDGAVLDVTAASSFLGMSEKTIRARVARRMIPFRRFGGRIVFLRAELEGFLKNLPGCGMEEAERNLNE